MSKETPTVSEIAEKILKEEAAKNSGSASTTTATASQTQQTKDQTSGQAADNGKTANNEQTPTDGGAKPTGDGTKSTGGDGSKISDSTKSMLSKYGTVSVDGDMIVFTPSDTKDEHGNVVKAKSVYKAATESDLLDTMFGGITEKDNTIRRLKRNTIDDAGKNATANLRQRSKLPAELPAVEETETPNINDIRAEAYNKNLRGLNIDMKYLRYTNDDWRKDVREDKLLDYEVIELRQQIKAFYDTVEKESNERYTDTVTQQANYSLVNAEIGNLNKLVDTLGIEVDPDEINEIMQQVVTDKDSYNDKGIYVPGSLQLAVMSHLKPNLSKKEASTLQKKIEADVEQAEKKAADAAKAQKLASEKGGAAAQEASTKPLKHLRDAKKAILEDIASGRLKINQ